MIRSEKLPNQRNKASRGTTGSGQLTGKIQISNRMVQREERAISVPFSQLDTSEFEGVDAFQNVLKGVPNSNGDLRALTRVACFTIFDCDNKLRFFTFLLNFSLLLNEVA